MQAMVWDTSLLDPEEGIRFRGFSIPELQEKLPAAKENSPFRSVVVRVRLAPCTLLVHNGTPGERGGLYYTPHRPFRSIPLQPVYWLLINLPAQYLWA